ncbi:hypothetical protein N7470_005655 [Penicillium chermesinum]|nr:hypothetical protein N7470_005655 [Penicillium chermesinum]
MRATFALRNAARTPLIRFVGKRSVPQSVDHTPRVHPAAPTSSLPDSFAAYREKAQQHGPLGRAQFTGTIGGTPGASWAPSAPNPLVRLKKNDRPLPAEMSERYAFTTKCMKQWGTKLLDEEVE